MNNKKQRHNIKKDNTISLNDIQQFLSAFGVINPSEELAENFYHFQKEKQYYVNVCEKALEIRNIAIEDFLKNGCDISFDNEQQLHEWLKYSTDLLKEIFLEFVETSQKFMKIRVGIEIP